MLCMQSRTVFKSEPGKNFESTAALVAITSFEPDMVKRTDPQGRGVGNYNLALTEPTAQIYTITQMAHIDTRTVLYGYCA